MGIYVLLMYRGLRAIVAFALYVRTTSRCVRLRQQLWPLMTGNGCATYTPPHTQLASYSHHEGISKLTTTTSLYSKSQWTRSSRNISGHIEYALAAQAYLGLHSNVIRMRWARLRVLILSVCVIPQFL